MASSTPETAASPHPMVAVPDAIRTVLEVTAKMVLSSTTNNNVEEVPSSSPSLMGRILAEDVVMSKPGYPPYRASIMDGYAIRSQSYQAGVGLQVSGRVHAGPSSDAQADNNNNNTAIYVTTGARIPDGYDCVVPIELITTKTVGEETTIQIDDSAATIQPNKWIRGVGCDISEGSVVIPRGTRLDNPVCLGLLQQSGQATVKLVPRIRVGVLSTGNELLVTTEAWAQHEAGTLIQTGQIPDVNKPVLQALLTHTFHCQAIDLGMERDDDIDSMTKTLQEALVTCDVILTTGGISMGETDIVEDVLVRRLGGTLHFGRIHMKPGKPTTFVTVGSTLVFALPGNPVSATVCTHLLVRPALNLLQQHYHYYDDNKAKDATTMVQNTPMPPEITATLAHDISLDQERPEYHRVSLELQQTREGTLQYVATSTGVQRSSRLMSLRDAQGLLVLPRGTAQQPKALAGQSYTVLLLNEQDGIHPTVLFQNSKHLNDRPKKEKEPTKVAILQISQNEGKYPFVSQEELSASVENALSGSKSGSTVVVSFQQATAADYKTHLASPPANGAGIWVVACAGSFLFNLEVSQHLRTQVVGKVADAMALQARKGVASQDGTAALFEPIVGFVARDNKPQEGCMLIALPTKGVQGGLENVRGLLKHGLNVARGKPHNHHHAH